MNELFIQPIEFEKVSYKRISENPAEWTGNIMEAFYNQFPYFANTPVSVTLSQKDEAKGYALGQIVVEEGAGMTVPIIIKNRELFPFDVCIMQGTTLPLTETTLNLYVQGRSAFLKAVKPEAGDITNMLFNSSFSQQIVPSYVTESYKQSSLSEDSAMDMLKARLQTSQQAAHTRSGVMLGKALGVGHSAATGSDPRAAVTAGATMGAALTNVQKFDIKEDAILDKIYKVALLGGQIKADEIFTDLKNKTAFGSRDSLIYMMLCFKRWAGQQGFEIKGWDVPGFEKTAMEEDEETKKHEKSESKKEEKAEDKREEKKDKKEDKKEEEKKASILETILPTISQQMKDKFFDEFTKNASLVEGFKRNGTSGLILKIASAQPEKFDFKEKVRKELDRDIHYIYKNASHEYKAVFGSSKVNDPVEVALDNTTAALLAPIKTPFTYESEVEKIANAHAFITTVSGRRFLALEGNEFVEVEPQVKIAAAGFKNQLESSEPTRTKYAMWEHNGKYSDPFEVTHVFTVGSKRHIDTWNGLEKKSYVRMQGVDSEFEERGNTYLPVDTKFIKLGELTQLPTHKIDVWANGNAVYRADNDTYVLRGTTFSEFNKTASKDMDVHKANWTVLQLGGSVADIEKIAALKVGESYTIAHELNIPLSFEKVAEQYNKAYSDAAKQIAELTRDMIKEASVITDVPTVDAVLSLNFVNKNNIQEFAAALPSFMDIAQKLSDMLLKTRLGIQIVDESVLRRVMLGLIEVIDVLTGVSNLQAK
jgi:hypothetical protein